MGHVELCNRISEAICQIFVFENDKIQSVGSGVFVEGGHIYTAAHVIVDKDKNDKPHGTGLLVRGNNYLENIKGKWSGPLRKGHDPKIMRSLPVDVAAIKPNKIPDGVNHQNVSPDFAPVGTECIMAGFSDDIDKPLQFENYFETRNPDMTKLKEKYKSGFQKFLRPCMFKKCMVGSRQNIELGDPGKELVIKGAEYWLDNHLTYGGSGGAVVNLDGELLGIVSRKGLTDATKFGIRKIDPSGVKSVEKLPSGVGLSLSHQFITDSIKADIFFD
jgi:hypothetical protein